ncbi:MAG: caspase family protein [Sphingobacteriaceae bacterium]|nr:caspase family protein [Sphingobacteriaceae bacterium]
MFSTGGQFKKLSLLLCVLFLGLKIEGQENKYSSVYFYRSDIILCNSLSFDIILNETRIHTLKPAGSLEYNMYSTGKLLVYVRNTISDNVGTASIMIEPHKKYYVRIGCSLYGIYLSVNEPYAISDWERAKKKYSAIYEDTDHPIIRKNHKDANFPDEDMVFKNDTIKQIVYVNGNKKYEFKRKSDVDQDIPITNGVNKNTFALIIGNEDYTSFQTELKSESNVPFARNDASAFKEYAIKTFGVPEKNITFLLDATYGQISQAIHKLNLLAKNTGGQAKLILYYAGHGMPEEKSKEPYLIPVDISGANVNYGIKLSDCFEKLSEFPSKQIFVILDACFTGGARNDGLIAGRSITVKPKEQTLKGNMVVLSSSSGNQSSLSYKEMEHGMFTYYLLKKLKESKGETSLKELFDYLGKHVPVESLLLNNKEQNPHVQASPESKLIWQQWKLK